MAVNPLGYQNITDGGTPRIVTGYTKEVVSGGNLLGASGATGVVTSGAASFQSTDIELFNTTGSGNFVGVCLFNAASGASASFATRGSFLLEVSGTNVLAGQHVGCNDKHEIIFIGSAALGYSSAINQIGRSWTAGSDGEFIVVDIHG